MATFLSPERGRPRRVLPGLGFHSGGLVRPEQCEKSDQIQPKTSNFLTENIDTGTRSGGSNKCPNVSRVWCPPCPRAPASRRCVCRERDRFPTVSRSPNLSECAVDLRGRAVTRSKSFCGSAHISGRAKRDVGRELCCLREQSENRRRFLRLRELFYPQ